MSRRLDVVIRETPTFAVTTKSQQWVGEIRDGGPEWGDLRWQIEYVHPDGTTRHEHAPTWDEIVVIAERVAAEKDDAKWRTA